MDAQRQDWKQRPGQRGRSRFFAQATHDQVIQAAKVANMDYVFDGSRYAGFFLETMG